MHYLRQLTSSRQFKKSVILTFLIISVLVWFGFQVYGKYYLSNDDAYVGANVVQIAPRITGQISKLYIADNQYVQKNQLLFSVDPQPFQLALDSAKAQIAINQAGVVNAFNTTNRTLALVKKNYSSPQDSDNAIAALKTAQAKMQYAQANLSQAQLNVQYTTVTAPTSGWVTNVSLRVGDVVAAYQPLFALISDAEFWVDANFKETEVRVIKPGQTVDIVTDLYPHHPFKGVVQSISGGTGAVFSLLPPQNATGNWVKVTQRIPVRIKILNPDPAFPLRIGVTATVTVHLHSGK